MNEFLTKWQIPPGLEELGISEKFELKEIRKNLHQKLAREKNKEEKVRLELKITDFLYDLIRMNIKRGRIFTIERALSERKADCLAYCQILEILAKKFGLDIGIVEVLIDNGGRYVSHPCNLLKLSDDSWRLIDLWYGSKNINHKRIGAWIKENGKWIFKDINEDEFSKIEDIKGLSEKQIAGLTSYTLGNIAWNRKDWTEAIACYTRAIELYPENARFYYNRAGAYCYNGDEEKEKADREEAFKRDPTGIRLLAEEHKEIEDLIKLDELGMNEAEQRRYLFNQGFITGKKETIA
jgi:tetratricopeptide (TPR) repeat protein